MRTRKYREVKGPGQWSRKWQRRDHTHTHRLFDLRSSEIKGPVILFPPKMLQSLTILLRRWLLLERAKGGAKWWTLRVVYKFRSQIRNLNVCGDMGHAEWNRNRGWTWRFRQNWQNVLLKHQCCTCTGHAVMLLLEDAPTLALRLLAGPSMCMHWGPCRAGQWGRVGEWKEKGQESGSPYTTMF